jgi:hypothetical protein
MAKISSDRKGIDEHALQLLIPQEILECFELTQVVENETEVLFDLVEKESVYPMN